MMRLGGLIDMEGTYRQNHENPVDPSSTGENAPQETPPSGAPPTAPPETPAETPGPAGNPQSGQGGPPPQTHPGPPQTGQGQGLKTNMATGGLSGSFAQAGTSGFNKMFGGSPASWFRNFGQEKKNEIASIGRGNSGEGGMAGGGLPGQGPMASPSMGSEGGGKNDEEWQRFIAEVNRQRFGQGRG